MSSSSKSSEGNSCFVPVPEPGRDASDPSQIRYSCSLCPITKRLISGASLRQHLQGEKHLASLERKAEETKKEAKARKDEGPMKKILPKKQLLAEPIKKSGVQPVARSLPGSWWKTPSLTPKSSGATLSDSTGAAKNAALKKEDALKQKEAFKKAEVERKKKETMRIASELVILDEDEPLRKKTQDTQIKEREDDTAYAECLKRAQDLVKEYLAAKRDTAHDRQHVDRVRRMALDIAKTLKSADLKIVELLAIFHILDAKSSQCPNLHTLLAPFFSHPSTTRCLTFAQVLMIQNLIPLVSWEGEQLLRDRKEWSAYHDSSIELKAVQDADRLDGMGAVGLMRSVAAGAKEGRVLFGQGAIVGEEPIEAQIKREQLIIKSGMKTELGKAEAERRHKTMRTWFDAVHAETQSAPL